MNRRYALLALLLCSCTPGSEKKEPPPAQKARTVIYDPKAMARIEDPAARDEFKVKDYYVNVLVVELPVESPAWVKELDGRSFGSLRLTAVKRGAGQRALSPEDTAAMRENLTATPPAWGRALRASWPAEAKGKAAVELTKEKPATLADGDFFGRLPGWLDKTGHGLNGWVTLPAGQENANRARLKKIIEAAGKVSPVEKVLLFVVPVGHAEAPLLLLSSSDGASEGSVEDVLPTLQEAMHSEPEKKSEPRGKSLFRSFFDEPDTGRVGVAYFLGGRTAILYRPYLGRRFDQAGVNLVLYSKSLYDRRGQGFLSHKDYYRIPKDPVFTKSQFKATGIELIEFMMASGKIGASIGETAFLQGLERKVPMVAVAELGFDAKEAPGHAMVLCKNLPYDKPADLAGKKFGSRRSAGGDELMLREFVAQAGLDPDKDVTIFGNMPDDKLNREIENGGLDGMYAHLMSIPGMPKHCRVIRMLDWVNPEISSALLVFPRDWLQAHREEVKKALKVLVQQVALEGKMTKAERRNKAWKNVKGVEIEMDTDKEKMQLPRVRQLPTVRIGLLQDLQKLFRKHHVSIVENDVDIAASVDNSLLEEIGKELGVSPDDQK